MAESIERVRAVVKQDTKALSVPGAKSDAPTIRSGTVVFLTHKYQTAYYGQLERDATPVWLENRFLDFIQEDEDEAETKEPEEQDAVKPDLLAEALYSFDAEEHKIPSGLSFDKGDGLVILGQEGGWYFGMCEKTRKSGIFPKTFVSLGMEAEPIVSAPKRKNSKSSLSRKESDELFEEIEREFFNLKGHEIVDKVMGDLKMHCSRSFAWVVKRELARRRKEKEMAIAEIQKDILAQVEDEHGILLAEIDRLNKSRMAELAEKEEQLARQAEKMKELQHHLTSMQNEAWLQSEFATLQGK